MRAPIAVAAAITAVLAPTVASAHQFTGFRWHERAVEYRVDFDSAEDLDRATLQAVIEDSYAAWTAPDCVAFTATFAGEGDGWQTGDRALDHVFVHDPSQRPPQIASRSVLGVTLSMFQGDRAIDGDILYNGIDHTWTTAPSAPGEVDAQSIVTHEVGHQLGLAHSPEQEATMFFAYRGGIGGRTLHPDDISGICALYPSGSDVECVFHSDCAGGEICDVGSCVPAPPPGSGGVGAACPTGDGDCASGHFCVRSPEGDRFCTRNCEDDCDGDFACRAVSTNRGPASLCLPGDPAPTDGGPAPDRPETPADDGASEGVGSVGPEDTDPAPGAAPEDRAPTLPAEPDRARPGPTGEAPAGGPATDPFLPAPAPSADPAADSLADEARFSGGCNTTPSAGAAPIVAWLLPLVLALAWNRPRRG